MPRVPQYGQNEGNAQQVSPSGEMLRPESIQATPAAFGARVGAATENLGKTALDVTTQYAEMQKQTDALQAADKYVQQKSDDLDKFMQLRGKDAVTAYPAYRDKILSDQQDMANSMSPYERLHFLQNTRLFSFNLMRNAATHTAQQQVKESYDTGVSQVKLGADMIGKEPFNPDVARDAYSKATQGVELQGQASGWTQDQIDARKEQAFGQVESSAIKSAIGQSPQRALSQLKDAEFYYPHTSEADIAHYQAQAQKQIDTGKAGIGIPILNNSHPLVGADTMKMVEDEAEKQGVPKEVARAVAIQESGMRMNPPGSNDGGKAVGIFQLHEGAAQDTGVDRTTMAGNIQGGIGYLKQMHDQFGDWDKAVAAFNAGPGTLRGVGGDISKLAPERQAYVNSVKFLARLDPAALMSRVAGNPMSQQQVMQNLSAMTPLSDDTRTIAKLDGSAQQIAQQVFNVKESMLQHDPLGYLSMHNQLLEGAQTEAMKDPSGMLSGGETKLGYYMKTVDNMYDSLNQPKDNRPLFSQAFATGIGQKLSTVPLTQGLQAMEQLKSGAGTAWPRIETQLARTPGVPPQLMVGMSIDNPAMQGSFARSYEMEGEPGKHTEKKDFSQIMPNFAAVNRQVDSALASSSSGWLQYNQSLARSRVPDSTLAAFNDGVKRLTMQLMLERGSENAGEVTKAAVGAFTSKWDMSMTPARIPKEIAPAIKSNASDALSALKGDDLMISNVTQDASTKESYLQGVRGGSWVTNPDETGLYRVNSSYAPVYKRDGTLLTVPFTWPSQGHAEAQVVPSWSR